MQYLSFEQGICMEGKMLSALKHGMKIFFFLMGLVVPCSCCGVLITVGQVKRPQELKTID
jgi:hypothetical protein